jgi:hypothetical protein
MSNPFIFPETPELDYRPIVSRRAFAAAFPTVHPFAAVGVFVGDENPARGQNEVFFFCEEIVGGIQYFTAEPFGSQVSERVNCGDSLMISFTFSKAIVLYFWFLFLVLVNGRPFTMVPEPFR